MANFAEYAIESAGVPPAQTNADTFGYNDRSEVVFSHGATENTEYSYDGIGNLLTYSNNCSTSTYTANCLNQYTSISNLCASASLREFSYDLDGNLLTNGVFSFTYDAENRLSSVSSNGTLLATFAYDAQGRRVRKIVSHGGTETRSSTYLWDGWNLVEELIAYTNGTTSTTRYFWGLDLSHSLQGAGGVGGLLYLAIDGVPYVPTYDNNGNITKYLDEQGDVVASYTYDAFGNTIAQSGPMADIFSHRFSTKYFDAETGLYYYGYRFYSPELMRWINRDPIGEEGGGNLYAFCQNNAIESIDSLGENRYITQFDFLNIGGSGGTQIHVGVAVDLWTCSGGKWKKTGIETYHFQIDYTQGLGNIIVGMSGLAKGRILVSRGLDLTNPIVVSSDPCQDEEMRQRIRRDVQNPPVYNVFFHNCIVWSVVALNYGMEKKCRE